MLKKTHWAAAVSFSHLSTDFGAVRWHIKFKKQKVTVQNHLFHIGQSNGLSTFLAAWFFNFCNILTHQFWGVNREYSDGHPGTSCPKKMKTAVKLPFSHRKHYCMDHVWGVGFFGTFHSEKMASRTSKPHVSYRHQKTVKCLWAA